MAAAVKANEPPAAAMPAFGSQPGLPAFTAANNKIFMDGKPIRLRGANWFGFEGANAVVDGLWERPMSE